jgi:hypothetical protein
MRVKELGVVGGVGIWIGVVTALIGLTGGSVAHQTLLPGPDAPTIYSTGDFGERTSRLTLADYPTPSPKYAVFCIDLGTAPVGGEVLYVSADMQVTNDLGFNVSIVTQVILDTTCGTDGTEIAEANGENAIPAVHHEVAVRQGGLLVPSGNSARFVVLVAWASSTAAQAGQYVQVNQDYGRMTVLRWD